MSHITCKTPDKTKTQALEDAQAKLERVLKQCSGALAILADK